MLNKARRLFSNAIKFMNLNATKTGLLEFMLKIKLIWYQLLKKLRICKPWRIIWLWINKHLKRSRLTSMLKSKRKNKKSKQELKRNNKL